MSSGDIIVVCILAAFIILAVVSLIHTYRKGSKCCGCAECDKCKSKIIDIKDKKQ